MGASTELRPPSPISESSSQREARVSANKSLIKRASSGDERALEEMIRSFVPDDESIVACGLVGTFGLLFKMRAFFAVTDRRAVSVIVGPYRAFIYTDGMLEHVNSSGIGQPSRGGLYLARLFIWAWVGLISIAAFVASDENSLYLLVVAAAVATGLLLSLIVTRLWLRRKKAGIFLNVREGFVITSFVDVRRMPRALALYRDFSLARDDRLAALSLSAA